MTNDSLEDRIGEWRQYFLRRQAVRPADIDELEDHLRSQVNALRKAGLSDDEAFLVAVKRLGDMDSVSREFANEYSERLWKQLVVAGDGAASLAAHRDRVVLVVNVASACGLTPQYEGLQKLHEKYADRGLSVLGFPCNQFAGQEPGSEQEIKGFCSTRYGVTFPEPKAVHTDAPIVLGTDGVRKMSKSLGNTIEIFASDEDIKRQVMSMVTDTKRILRTDPGRPEVCNVCQMHRSFGDDYEEIWEGERTARTGCVDTKKLLLERILRHYAEPRERYRELMADPARIDRILDEGAERIRPIAQATMAEVREKMGLR